jgi:AcrR family transcriptional regulator
MSFSADLRRRAPQQARSRFMVQVILDAAAGLVVQPRGLETFTTRSVAELAGVSVGSLYQYFPDKNSILSMLHIRHSAELRTYIHDAATMDQDIGLSSKVKRIVDSVVGVHVANAGLHRIMETELLRWESSPEWQANCGGALETVRRMFLAHRDEIARTNIDLAAQITIEILETMAHMVVLRGTAGETVESVNNQIHLMIMNHLAGNGLH